MKSAKRTRKLQADRATRMSDEAFADLKLALEDALAFERAERRELTITRIKGSRPSKEPVKIQQSEKP